MIIKNSKTGELHEFEIFDNGEDWTTEFLEDTWYEWTTETAGIMASDDVDFTEILEDAIDHKYFFGGIFADNTVIYWDCELIEDSSLNAPDKFKSQISEALNVG
jgi:hypothetical protein